jgi:hypothetical protein
MKTFKEFINEAVGDPISPNSVFKLSDPRVQKNIQSAMRPAGPPPISLSKPKKQTPKTSSSYSDRFVKRVVGSTMFSPL